MDFQGKFLTGDNVTIADISIAKSLSMPTLMNQTFEAYPKVDAWLKTMNVSLVLFGRIVRRAHHGREIDTYFQAFPEMQAVDARFQPARAQIQEKLKKEGKL